MSDKLETLLATLVGEVHGMRAALEAMAIANSPEPRMVKPLPEYTDFDWSAINALVVARDKSGPTIVEWGGFQWKRRSRDDYGADIFFTRPNGKLPDGKVRYVRLITFKGDMGKVKPVPEATCEVMAEQTAALRGKIVPVPGQLTSPTQAKVDQVAAQPANPSAPVKRMWPGEFVKLVIRSGVAKTGNEAADLLNMSKLSTKDPEDIVIRWIGAYQKAIQEGGIPVEALFMADTTLPIADRDGNGGGHGAR